MCVCSASAGRDWTWFTGSARDWRALLSKKCDSGGKWKVIRRVRLGVGVLRAGEGFHAKLSNQFFNFQRASPHQKDLPRFDSIVQIRGSVSRCTQHLVVSGGGATICCGWGWGRDTPLGFRQAVTLFPLHALNRDAFSLNQIVAQCLHCQQFMLKFAVRLLGRQRVE
jgi:hypothetical protein